MKDIECRWADYWASSGHHVFQALTQDSISCGILSYLDTEVDDYMHQISADQAIKHIEEFIKEKNISSEEEHKIRKSLLPLNNKTPWSENQAPSHLNPNNLSNLATLRELGLPEGQNADCMLVGKNKHGEKVFITNISENVPGLHEEMNINALRAEKSSMVLSELGFSVPEHYYCDDEFLAVRECPGKALDRPDAPCISREKFLRFASGQMLIGNEDSRPCNVFVYNGELVPIDLKMAGRRIINPSIKAQTLATLFSSSITTGLYSVEEESKFISDLRQQLRQTVQKLPTEKAIENINKIEHWVSGVFVDNIQAVRKKELMKDDRKEIWIH
jgi:hypothetical protein